MQLKILIIYPHWPPCNLAGVHRARLTANALSKLGHEVHVVTVHEAYYEEKLDRNFSKTVHTGIQVHKVKALPITKPRIIGDIGLRAFYPLRNRAVRLLREVGFDFLWIPIPSFYTALLGPYLKRKMGVRYGIDYIDPWLRDITGRANWRARWSNRLAKWLEPKALATMDVVSGVAEEYYLPALRRNFKAEEFPSQVAFPYGYDPDDYQHLTDTPLPWSRDTKAIVYAGAFLPNAHPFLEALFNVLKYRLVALQKEHIHFYFVGTGNYRHKSIESYAKDYGVSNIITEDRARRSYLDVLHFLKSASGILVLGSTERHYTASKVYQAILAERPVFSVFHKESAAATLLQQTKHIRYCCTWDTSDGDGLQEQIQENLNHFLLDMETKIKVPEVMKDYDTRKGAARLVELITKVM